MTIEDGSIAGGAGSAVNEELNRVGIISRVINLGIPDQFIDHAGQEEQYAMCGIDPESIISVGNVLKKPALTINQIMDRSQNFQISNKQLICIKLR